jgi:hypothetical protein
MCIKKAARRRDAAGSPLAIAEVAAGRKFKTLKRRVVDVYILRRFQGRPHGMLPLLFGQTD